MILWKRVNVLVWSTFSFHSKYYHRIQYINSQNFTSKVFSNEIEKSFLAYVQNIFYSIFEAELNILLVLVFVILKHPA
jgi:hypothetical protein